MKISFFLKTKDGFQILAKATEVDKALDILKTIKADGVILDRETAQILLTRSHGSTTEVRQYVSSRTHQGIQRVPIQEIFYFQADQKYVMVHHQKGTLLIEDTLKELEIEFSELFLRIHRNLLVNIYEIQALEKDEQGNFWLRMRQEGILFPVSRRKVSLVRRRLK